MCLRWWTRWSLALVSKYLRVPWQGGVCFLSKGLGRNPRTLVLSNQTVQKDGLVPKNSPACCFHSFSELFWDLSSQLLMEHIVRLQPPSCLVARFCPPYVALALRQEDCFPPLGALCAKEVLFGAWFCWCLVCWSVDELLLERFIYKVTKYCMFFLDTHTEASSGCRNLFLDQRSTNNG